MLLNYLYYIAIEISYDFIVKSHTLSLRIDFNICCCHQRHSKRSGWASRVSDPIHRKLHPNERPMSIPYPAQGLWRLNESRTEVICNPTSNAATIAYSASKMDNDEGVKLQLNDLAKTLSWKAEKKNKKTLYKTRKLFAQVSTNEGRSNSKTSTLFRRIQIE